MVRHYDGDSITVHVAQRITQKLADVAQVVASPSVRTSGKLLSHLDEWLAGTAEIVCFNCGLHDLARDRQTQRLRHVGRGGAVACEHAHSPQPATVPRRVDAAQEGILTWQGKHIPIL